MGRPFWLLVGILVGILLPSAQDRLARILAELDRLIEAADG